MRALRISSSLRECFLDISKGSSAVDERGVRQQVETIKMVLVVFKEEDGGWIYSRTVTVDSREYS